MKKAFGFLLHRNQRDFWYFWSQKYILKHKPTGGVETRPYEVGYNRASRGLKGGENRNSTFVLLLLQSKVGSSGRTIKERRP